MMFHDLEVVVAIRQTTSSATEVVRHYTNWRNPAQGMQGLLDEMNMICSRVVSRCFKMVHRTVWYPVPVGMTSFNRGAAKNGNRPRWNSPQCSEANVLGGHKTLSRPKETAGDRQLRVATFRVLTLRADQHFQCNGSRRVSRSVRIAA
jgi:hypothetical protein